MKLPKKITIKDNRQYRAMTVMPNGQEVHCWLPKGDYAIGGVVKLYVDRDRTRMAEARQLFADKAIWYIGESIFQEMPKWNQSSEDSLVALEQEAL